MLDHERIRSEACGCRYDATTGLYTFRCREHEPEQLELEVQEPRGREEFRL
jgi:hypothetical protein